MAQQMKIEGAAELERLLKQLPPKVAQQEVEKALRAGARIVRDEAKRRVPVRTGRLRNSVTVATSKREGRSRVREGGIIYVGFAKPVSRRAHLTEFGTRHSAPRPFMRPAIDAVGRQAVEKIGETLGKGVERVALNLAGSYGGLRKSLKRHL